MPNITMMPSGINAAFAGGNPSPPKRGTCRGLTQGSARRCKAFLMSIETNKLDGIPINFTLTLRDCPPTSKDWDNLKRTFFKRLGRMGLIRLHHVTEWTRRGLPHLHAMGFFERLYDNPYKQGVKWVKAKTPISGNLILETWCDVAGGYGAKIEGQHSRREKEISVAWFKYMSKHASRGASHYQRQANQIPEGWQKTGRMWGKLGSDWPVYSESHEIDNWAFHHLRRQVRNMRRSQALTEIKNARLKGDEMRLMGGLSTLAYLRSQKRIVDPVRSALLPISEWIEADDTEKLLEGIHLNIQPKPSEDYRRIKAPPSLPEQEGSGLASMALRGVYKRQGNRLSDGRSQDRAELA